MDGPVHKPKAVGQAKAGEDRHIPGGNPQGEGNLHPAGVSPPAGIIQQVLGIPQGLGVVADRHISYRQLVGGSIQLGRGRDLPPDEGAAPIKAVRPVIKGRVPQQAAGAEGQSRGRRIRCRQS